MTLTNKDLKQIQNLIETNNEEVEGRFEKVATKIKSDFFDKIDPILQEVKASREERKIIARRLSDHNDDLEKIKTQLNI